MSLCVTIGLVLSTVISRRIAIQNVTYMTSDNDVSDDQTSEGSQQQQQQQQTDRLLYSSAVLNEVSTNSTLKNSRAGYLT